MIGIDLLAVVGAGTVGAATAAAAALAPAARRTYRMTPPPALPTVAEYAGPAGLPPDCDTTDFYPCPREQVRRPHAVSADGSRRCWSCGHPTPPSAPGETR